MGSFLRSWGMAFMFEVWLVESMMCIGRLFWFIMVWILVFSFL